MQIARGGIGRVSPRICCSSNLYASFDLEVTLRAVSGLGIEYVDLWASPAIAYHVRLDGEVQRIKNLLERYSLRIVSLTLYYTTPEERMRGFETAAELGAEVVVLEPAPAPGFFEGMSNLQVKGRTLGEPGDTFEEFVDNLTPLLGRASELGIAVALEVPHVYTLVETLPELARLMNAIPDRSLQFTLAPPHILIKNENLDEFVRLAAPRTALFYAWDVRAGYTAREGRAFGTGNEQSPGGGGLDFASVFRNLGRSGFSGVIDLKWHGTEGWKDLNAVNRLVASAHEHVRQSLESRT